MTHQDRKISKADLFSYSVRASNLRIEIKRITNVTLKGTFRFESDRDYWEKRVKKLNAELMAIEEIIKPR